MAARCRCRSACSQGDGVWTLPPVGADLGATVELDELDRAVTISLHADRSGPGTGTSDAAAPPAPRRRRWLGR